MSTMTYEEYRQKRQAEVNALPIFYAFSNEQLQEGMQKRWSETGRKGRCPLVKNGKDWLYSFGGGGFYFKFDAETVHDFISKPDPINELMKDPDFAYSAFYYEMGNHEYHINTYQGNWDVISCFANVEFCDDDWNLENYFKQLNWTDETKEAYKKARAAFLKAARENDWY